MSALGQKQTLRPEISMSALRPKADIVWYAVDAFTRNTCHCSEILLTTFDESQCRGRKVHRNFVRNFERMPCPLRTSISGTKMPCSRSAFVERGLFRCCDWPWLSARYY
jgi:hypothetical protein